MNDPYTILGVSSSASDEEISKAYKKLARQYHPDLNPGDRNAEMKMKEINSAYETVKDIRSGKKSYDTGTGGYTGSYRSYGSSAGYSDPSETYRGTYSGRYYGFNFDDLFREQDSGDSRQWYSSSWSGSSGRRSAFSLFGIFRSLLKFTFILALLRFLFSLFFFPVF